MDALLAPARPQASSSTRPLPVALRKGRPRRPGQEGLHRTESPDTSLLAAAAAASAAGKGGGGRRAAASTASSSSDLGWLRASEVAGRARPRGRGRAQGRPQPGRGPAPRLPVGVFFFFPFLASLLTVERSLLSALSPASR
jgi:hypothetical protein